jgi:purine-nucleoside phosphorylase
MHSEETPVAGIAEALLKQLGSAPATALILGSGLGPVVEGLTVSAEAGYADLGLPQSRVAGHAGRAVRGVLGSVDVAVFSGRVHLYEGHSPDVVVRGVRALARWGVKRLILTCSVGGISTGFDPGTLVAISDHINLQGCSPLVGPAFGTRFPDMTYAYDPGIREALLGAAKKVGAPMREGVLAAVMGPSYETPAEIRMIQVMGADIVGMSTVPEILAASEVGMTAAAIGVVSNRAAGLSGGSLSHSEVTENAGEAAAHVANLLTEALA